MWQRWRCKAEQHLMFSFFLFLILSQPAPSEARQQHDQQIRHHEYRHHPSQPFHHNHDCRQCHRHRHLYVCHRHLPPEFLIPEKMLVRTGKYTNLIELSGSNLKSLRSKHMFVSNLFKWFWIHSDPLIAIHTTWQPDDKLRSLMYNRFNCCINDMLYKPT